MPSTNNSTTLEKLRPPSVNTGTLVKHAESTFLMIERWNDTISTDAEVEDVICQVQDLGVVFFNTIKLSVEVAQRSLEVTRDAIMVFEAILAGDPIEDIQEFISSLRKKTITVYRKTKHVSQKFQEVAIGLDKITNEIPAIDARLKEREQEILSKNAIAQRRGDAVDAFQKAGIVTVGAASGLAAIFPPALLVMPVAVSLVVLASEVFRYKNKKHIKEREAQARDCREALRDLRDVSKTLTNLKKGTNMFSDFWLTVDISLDELAGRIKELRGNKANRLQIRAILSIWAELKDGYAAYLATLKRLEQVYRLSQIAKRKPREQPQAIEAPTSTSSAVLKKPRPTIKAAPPAINKGEKGDVKEDVSKKKQGENKAPSAARVPKEQAKKQVPEKQSQGKKEREKGKPFPAKPEESRDRRGQNNRDPSQKENARMEKDQTERQTRESEKKEKLKAEKDTKDTPPKGAADVKARANLKDSEKGTQKDVKGGSLKPKPVVKAVRFTPSTSS